MFPEKAVSQISLNSDGEDTISTSSTETEDYNKTVIAKDLQENPSFGNISVANSSDVHFGNKTFYQGPVTIKQILYTNGKAVNSEQTSNEIVVDSKLLPANGVDSQAVFKDFAANKTNPSTTTKPTSHENNAEFVTGFRRFQKLIRGNVVLLVSFLALLMLSLAILMVVLLLRHNTVSPEEITSSTPRDEQDKNTPIDAPIDPDANLTLPNKLKLVSRLEWVAQPPTQQPNVLQTPVPYVIILHTATENCSSQAQCVFHVRFIQTFHIESRNWWDIGYNFLVGGDGEAYEGRGWKAEGSHTFGYNVKSIGIAFIGTFNTFKPPQRQMVACKQLIAKGVELGYIRKDYKLLAARQLQTTQSPGAALYEEMKTWAHWAKGP